MSVKTTSKIETALSVIAFGSDWNPKEVAMKFPTIDHTKYRITQIIMTLKSLSLGFLKMDFLGLRTLSVIANCLELVKKNRGIDVVFDEKMNDPEVYKLWQEGKTYGI